MVNTKRSERIVSDFFCLNGPRANLLFTPWLLCCYVADRYHSFCKKRTEVTRDGAHRRNAVCERLCSDTADTGHGAAMGAARGARHPSKSLRLRVCRRRFYGMVLHCLLILSPHSRPSSVTIPSAAKFFSASNPTPTRRTTGPSMQPTHSISHPKKTPKVLWQDSPRSHRLSQSHRLLS